MHARYSALFVILLVVACGEPDPAIVATTVLGSTHDTAGPYHVDSVIVGVGSDDDVELMLAIDTLDPDRFYARTMAGDDERFRASIPGQPAGTDVYYFVRVVRDGDEVARDPASALAYSYGFQVLRPDGACSVDSECAIGAETCVEGVCTPLPDACEDAEQCPVGYRCDVETGSCNLQPRSCDDDDDCPTSDECSAGVCGARHLCSDVLPCPDGYTCNLGLGRCYAD